VEGALVISEKDKPDVKADADGSTRAASRTGEDVKDSQRATAQQKMPKLDLEEDERCSEREEKGVLSRIRRKANDVWNGKGKA
jgi:hypothetical protein